METATELGGVGAVNNLRDNAWLLRWGSLLYSVFWFIEPFHRGSLAVWAAFLAFYCVFLTGYFRVLRGPRTEQRIWLIILFLIGYVYYPFNPYAGGEFVFAVVLSGFFMRQRSDTSAFRLFVVVLVAQTMGLSLESWFFHIPWEAAEWIVFFMVVIGFSNFAYARQVFISRQLRLANEEIERLTQQAERERIARDLHDLLGHTLTVIAVKSDVAKRLFFKNPQLAQSEIAEVESTARQALFEVRQAVTGYRSQGIQAELELARQKLKSAGVHLLVEYEFITLSSAENDLLCFILREGVTNIIRHAAATECNIKLAKDDCVRLTIEDNGSGSASEEGNGIRGMRERLSKAHGRLHVGNSISGGFLVVAELHADSLKEDSVPSLIGTDSGAGKTAGDA